MSSKSSSSKDSKMPTAQANEEDNPKALPYSHAGPILGRLRRRNRAVRRIAVPSGETEVAKPSDSKPGEENDTSRSVSAVPLPTAEIDFAELEDGSLAELIEDASNPGQTRFAMYKEGEVRYVDHLEDRAQLLTPLPRRSEILKRLRLPRGVQPYESAAALRHRLERLIRQCVALHDTYVTVLAHFVISTWLVDRLPVAPYISVVGLPQSGKTTLLEVLSLVCRRPLLTADITSAAFCEVCARLRPTLLIDEAATHRGSRALRHFLRMGTTRDVVAIHGNRTFHVYGAKVICWLEPPDDPALNSRCILISMTEKNDPNLVKATDRVIEDEAAELQMQLLQFRFDLYNKLQTPSLSGADTLRPRTRDLLMCLAAPFAEDTQRCESLVNFFRIHDQLANEPLSAAQNAVLAALFCLIHQRSDSGVAFVLDLTATVNQFLYVAGEQLRLEPRKVGAILTSLGFTRRERTNKGWTVWLSRSDQERVHQLVKAYGIDRLCRLDLPISPEQCPMCEQEVRLNGLDQELRPGARTVKFENNMGFIPSQGA